MKSFLLMLSFFTRIPVFKIDYEEERYIRGIKYVPLIGLLMGGILYGIAVLCTPLDKDVTALVLLGSYVLLTGALHIDGMADTCDGIFSGRDRERILEIMRDSRTGVYGVLSIGFWLLFYGVMFRYVPAQALILMPVLGKSAALISGFMAPYIRAEGLGKVFAMHCGKLQLAVALLLPVLVAAALDPWYLIGTAAALGSAAFVTLGLKKAIGGITGDTMGFVCETTQMVFIFAIYLLTILK